MKRIAMLLMIGLVACFVLIGCEKSSDEGVTAPDSSEVTKAAEDAKATAEKETANVDVDKEADKAKEGLDALTK